MVDKVYLNPREFFAYLYAFPSTGFWTDSTVINMVPFITLKFDTQPEDFHMYSLVA